MRTFLVASALLNTCFVAHLLLFQEPRAVEAGPVEGPPTAVENGDTNGDRILDVSDAVYLLFHLFRGGDAPVAIESPECPECPECPQDNGLPATGQKNCFDDFGLAALCNNADFPGQDGSYRSGCGENGRFLNNGDGTVTDNCTGLMWTQHTQDINGDVEFDHNDRVTWQVALKFCEDRDLAGKTDWRLPNVVELQSLSSFAKDGAGISASFNLVAPDIYWTSTTDSVNPVQAWFVEFSNGGSTVESAFKRSPFAHVLCVRQAE